MSTLTEASRVLVVDDELGLRDLMTYELSAAGHHVVSASSGAEAIRLLEAGDFDLVVSDYRMPGLSGADVIRAVKRLAPHTEVIIVSGHAEVESAIECLREGACDLLQKPFLLEAFHAATRRALERGRLRVTARLYEATRLLRGNCARDDVPDQITRMATRVLDAEWAGLRLVEPGDPSWLKGGVMVPGTGSAMELEALSTEVATTRRSRILASGGPGGGRTWLVCPLIQGDDLVGVLQICRPAGAPRFRAEDLELAGVVAAHGALALKNLRLAQELLSSDRLATIGQAAAGIVHEIGNPTAFIAGNLEFAKEAVAEVIRAVRPESREPELAKTCSELTEALADAHVGAQTLKQIVRDMRLLSHGGGLAAEPFGLAQAVRAALRISGMRRTRTTVQLELDEEVEILGSAGQMAQVFLNLLVNALHATEARAHGEIAVRVRRDGALAVAEVRDNGTGIQPEHLSKLFEPFFTTKGPKRGTGLGLSICREIVERHGGSLTVASEPGVGTCFTVSMPVAGPRPPAASESR